MRGQKPVITKAKKSIAGFKLREGMGIGVKVTLRKAQMYEFLDRFVNITLPRIRDFQGISDKSFDGRGNYSMGIKEHIVFPEIDYDKVDKIRGLDVMIVTSAKNDKDALALLKGFNMPFPKEEKVKMAKVSAIAKNNRRRKMTKKYAARREALNKIVKDRVSSCGR